MFYTARSVYQIGDLAVKKPFAALAPAPVPVAHLDASERHACSVAVQAHAAGLDAWAGEP